jgi:hypothetical protein
MDRVGQHAPVAGLSGRIRVAVSPETAMRAGSRFDLFSLSSSYTLSPQVYVLGTLVTALALRPPHRHRFRAGPARQTPRFEPER